MGYLHLALQVTTMWTGLAIHREVLLPPAAAAEATAATQPSSALQTSTGIGIFLSMQIRIVPGGCLAQDGVMTLLQSSGLCRIKLTIQQG